jgi:hypothetical protein
MWALVLMYRRDDFWRYGASSVRRNPQLFSSARRMQGHPAISIGVRFIVRSLSANMALIISGTGREMLLSLSHQHICSRVRPVLQCVTISLCRLLWFSGVFSTWCWLFLPIHQSGTAECFAWLLQLHHISIPRTQARFSALYWLFLPILKSDARQQMLGPLRPLFVPSGYLFPPVLRHAVASSVRICQRL